jgi:hypothetical protein
MSINRLLAEAFASVVASIELSDDDDIDPDIATTILEPIGALFRSMTEEERVEFTELMGQCAESEVNPERREIILGIPDAFGLTDQN